jgi:hypothetical protein
LTFFSLCAQEIVTLFTGLLTLQADSNPKKGTTRKQMAKERVTEISYYEIVNIFGPNEWRCHVMTDQGGHYQAEAYTKGEAKRNALDAMRANN